ncbi:hypothetical protein Scep_029188 [Stephania cephalantha]|uniref:Uncharacterized protein n=1 Tax=Stephania cephalantha TaxID=152367 RepID=A0AAP0E0R5_9MAGN
MLCSTSTTKSTTNWLDRLRSSKGFPPQNDDVDLEDFLNRNPNSDPHSIPQKTDQNQVTDRPKQHDPDENRTKRDDWFDIMSSALAELFVMGGGGGGGGGDSRRFGGRETRSSRKRRQNPKLCAIPTSATASVDDLSLNGGGGAAALSPSSADNSVAGAKTKKMKNVGGDRDRFEAALAEAEEDRYSRVDVTVIDTSAPVWRSEKIIFRKGSVWKVRDKNSKCRKISSLRKKKRKASQFDEEVVGGKNEKKRRKKKKKKKQKVYSPSHSLPPPPRVFVRVIRRKFELGRSDYLSC